MSSESSVRRVEKVDVNWNDLNKKKFYTIVPLASVAARFLVFPLSMVKVHAQTQYIQSNNNNYKPQKPIQIAKNIYHTHGFTGFYRGFTVHFMGVLSGPVYATLLELSNQQCHNYFFKTHAFTYLNPNRHYIVKKGISGFISGTIAAIVAMTIQTPFDVLAQFRMVSLKGITDNTHIHTQQQINLESQNMRNTVKDLPKNSTQNRNLSKKEIKILKLKESNRTIDIFKRLMLEDGITSLWRGYTMAVITYVPTSSILWGVYYLNKSTIYHFLKINDNTYNIMNPSIDKAYHYSFKRDTLICYMSGFMAGIVASWITMPLDTIRTRKQVLSKPGTYAFYIAKDILKTQGIHGFWKGASARMASHSFNAGLLLSLYEFMKRKSMD